MILLLVRCPYFIIVPMIFHEVLMFPTIFHMFTFQNFHISNYVHHLFQWFSLSLPHFAASLLKVANFGSMTSKPLAWRKPGKTSENQWHCLLFLNEFLKIFNSSFFDQFSMFLAWFFQVFSGFPVPKRPFLATSHVEGHFPRGRPLPRAFSSTCSTFREAWSAAWVALRDGHAGDDMYIDDML